MLAELTPFLLLSFKWDGFSWTSNRDIVWGIQGCSRISFPAHSSHPPPLSLQYASYNMTNSVASPILTLWAQPESSELLLPALDFLVPSLALSSTIMHSQTLFLGDLFYYPPPLGSQTPELVCLSFPSALEFLSLSYTPVVPAQLGGPHLRSNCRLEMLEIPELSEALCPPCLPPQSSHSHLLPVKLHQWCNLYATEFVSFLCLLVSLTISSFLVFSCLISLHMISSRKEIPKSVGYKTLVNYLVIKFNFQIFLNSFKSIIC